MSKISNRIYFLALLPTFLLVANRAPGCGRGAVNVNVHRIRPPAARPWSPPPLWAYDSRQTNPWRPVYRPVPGRLYVLRFKARWYWVTADDFRPIAPGTKVQWKRIEPLGDRSELDWYRLDEDAWRWTKVTDRERPAIYRLERNGQRVLSELYPENWQSLGGAIDPEPSSKPYCKITPNPRSVVVNQPLTLHIELTGTISDVVVAGQHLPIHLERNPPFAEIVIHPQAPGFYTASATVKGSKDQFTCEAPYDVQLANSSRTAEE